MSEEQRARVAYLMGSLAAIHGEAKRLEAEGVEEMDMVACQVEDTYSTLLPLVDNIGQVQALAINS